MKDTPWWSCAPEKPWRTILPVFIRRTGKEGRTTREEKSRGMSRVVVTLGALSAFGPLSIDMYLPALPSMTRSLGSTASLTQLTLTACLAGLALGQMYAGPASDALGRKRPLLLGVALYAAASVLCLVAPSVYLLIAMRFVQGIGGAAGIVIARAMVRDLRSGVAAARMFSTMMLINGLAPILAPLIGGQILRFAGWRVVFALLAAIGLALFVAASRLPETLPAARRRPGSIGGETGRALRVLVSDRAFVGRAMGCGLGFAAMFAYISGSPFVLQDIYGVSPQTFSLLFGINALGLALANQLNGLVVGKLSPEWLLIRGLSATAAGGVGLLAVVASGKLGMAAVLACLFVVVSSLGFVMPNATALALTNHPQEAGTASALLGVFQFAVGALVAPLVGIGGAHTALPMGIIIALLGTMALLSQRIVPAARRRGT